MTKAGMMAGDGMFEELAMLGHLKLTSSFGELSHHTSLNVHIIIIKISRT